MAVEFQEYKGKRKPINPQHKFPLLRLLLVALAAFLVYWSGLTSKIANALPLPGNEPEIVEETWESRCVATDGMGRNLSDSLAECSWGLSESNQDSLLLPDPFLRYLASLRKVSYAQIFWIAPVSDFSNPFLVSYQNDYGFNYYRVRKADSSYVWIRKAILSDVKHSDEELQKHAQWAKDDGCRFPGVCPHMPLEWSALPITEGFDFEGQESLIAADVFRGIGEAPVYAILPGKVQDLGKDSLGYFVDIDHGNNITSRTSGLGLRNESLSQGDSIRIDVPIGRLAPLDSAVFYLSVRESGRFVRWKDFYQEAYPASDKEIRTFLDHQMKLLDGK